MVYVDFIQTGELQEDVGACKSIHAVFLHVCLKRIKTEQRGRRNGVAANECLLQYNSKHYAPVARPQ